MKVRIPIFWNLPKSGLKGYTLLVITITITFERGYPFLLKRLLLQQKEEVFILLLLMLNEGFALKFTLN